MKTRTETEWIVDRAGNRISFGQSRNVAESYFRIWKNRRPRLIRIDREITETETDVTPKERME